MYMERVIFRQIACLLVVLAIGWSERTSFAQTAADDDYITHLINAAAFGHGQEGQPEQAINLTLDDALERTLERNLDIAVQRLVPLVFDLNIAERQSFYRPILSTDFGNTSQITPSRTQLDGGRSVETASATFNSTVGQPVPWGGGNFDVSWNNNRLETTNFFSSFNPSYRSSFAASYTQPLMRGFKIDTARQQLAITRINRDISDVDLRETITNTLTDVRTAYWELRYAVAAVDVQRQALELAEQLVRDNQARVEIGTLAPIDIVQAQSEAAARRQSLALAEQNLRTAELTLKRFLVDGTEDELWRARLNPVDQPAISYNPIDIEAAVRTALDQRTDLTRARRQRDINNVNVRTLRNNTLPALDLVGTYQLQGQGGTRFTRQGLGGAVGLIIPGGFGDAIDQLVDVDFPTWTLQLQLNYPLGQSAAGAAYARSRLELQQTEAQMRQIELQIATDVTSAALQIDSIQKRIEAAAAARALADEQLAAEESKFEVGQSTNFFVVQAQRDLATAQDTELRAILDYQNALIEFERAQQTSLTRAGISIVGTGGGGQ